MRGHLGYMLKSVAVSLFLLFYFSPDTSAAQAQLAWDPDAGQVAGYEVYHGPSSGNYTNTLDAGNNTTYTLQNLSASTYYVAVAAYDSNNNQSGFSPELAIDSLTASAGAGGSIAPSGTFFQSQGSSQTFTITPAAGYAVADVQVDGASVGAVSSYTFNKVTANHTIAATFAPIPTYTITATVQGSGLISPSGAVRLPSGTKETFTITPAHYYQLAYVLVDGESYGVVSGGTTSGTSGGTTTGPATYTFTNVSSNHTIQAVFLKVAPPVADAGPDQDVKSGSIVELNGSNSTDSVSGIASYKWTQTLGSKVRLSNPSARECTFTAPNIASAKVLAFNLAVTNKAGLVTKASCIVNVSSTDQTPSANAGANQTVYP